MALSIRAKLWLPPLALAAVLVSVGGFSAWQTSRLITASDEQHELQQERQSLAARWAGLTETNAARTLAVLMSNEPHVEDSLKADMKATTAAISKIQDRITEISTGADEKAVLGTIAERRKAYIASRNEIMERKKTPGADVTQLIDQTFRPALAGYTAAQQDYVKIEHDRFVALREEVAASRMHMLWSMMGILSGVVVAMLFGAWMLVRQLCEPLARVATMARRIGEGDLTQDIRPDRHDEVGEVVKTLAVMQGALRDMVAQVRQSSESIQVASSEVAVGNQDLSQRTEQTASNLQNAASSMEQLTGTVRQTADSASTANQLASSAAQAAQRGGDVVSQVVSNMQEITASSRKIGEIIGVIDGIAFQTNILALNAAVEAARAGEQGRGFAVVAGEVRNLAQRSATAAREIKTLINASVEKVESGSRLVQDAGATMGEIVSGVQRVSDIIGEITAATSEQSGELGQVNVAVTHLDQMTQQNAALVEQSAAAAESLKDQADKLAGVVSVFRLQPGLETAVSMSRTAPVSRSGAGLPTARPAPKPASAVHASAPKGVSAPPRATVSSTQSATAGSAASDTDWETF